MSESLKKPEKLASALYLVTSFFADQEPLKWRLRSLAADLVSLSTIFRDSFYEGKRGTVLETRSVVLETASLLTVAKNAGLISDMNFNIIHKEFLNLIDQSALPVGVHEENGRTVLSSKFFNDEEIRERIGEEKSPENFIKDKNLPAPHAQEDMPGKREFLPPVSPIKGQNLKDFGAVSVKKNGRQSIIIGLLKRKREIMIKDVSALISGCSEKTIQRELLAMVQSGILKKEGEKRWSKYSLS